MLRRSSVLILLAIVIPALSTNAKECPSDITNLAFTSALKADCRENTEKACRNSSDKYRSVDGTCNHILTNSGSTGSVISKLLSPTYDDGSSTPRERGVGGEALPSARTISVNIFTDKVASAGHPLSVFHWGQWVAHDIVSTTSSPRDSCCGPNGEFPAQAIKNCFPIELPPNDPSFPGTCLSFVRSQAANCSNSCQIGFRVNINAVTFYIDNSQIYGSDLEVAKSVREAGTSLLRTSHGNFPPESNATCNKPNPARDFCFLTGDDRSNQNSILSGLHTLWIREHNRIATTLEKLNPSLSAEEVFQITKKIINGIHQSITYNVYLPIILGDEGVRRWKLLSKSGRSTYNSDVIPRLVQEFTTAAYRFGHSQVLGNILIGKAFILLRYLYNNPSLNLDHFQDIMATLIDSNQSSQVVDKHFSKEVSQNLLFNNKTGRGGDLLSNNIQRGRDHGLPTYAQVREFCCLPPITGFDDTEALGAEGYKLGTLYKCPEDIDLYVGMLHETAKSGLLGPTFQCLVGLQFYILKYGDRYFFDNDQGHFTDIQLEAIRRVKLGEIICHHTSFTEVQENVFDSISSTNAAVSCASLKENGLDLSLFV